MIQFIEVTGRGGNKILINPQTIGHLYSETETGQWGGEERGRVITIVGVATHNNGGFKVLETVEDVLHKIHLATV